MQNKKKKSSINGGKVMQFQLHTLMLPGTILMLVFSILPLYGLLLAFKNYKVTEGIWASLPARGMESRTSK